MRDNFVIDPLISKRQQLLLATQLCRMVLKVSVRRFLHRFLSTQHALHTSAFLHWSMCDGRILVTCVPCALVPLPYPFRGIFRLHHPNRPTVPFARVTRRTREVMGDDRRSQLGGVHAFIASLTPHWHGGNPRVVIFDVAFY